MDVCQMIRTLRFAARGSLVLLGATVTLAGDRPHEQPTRPHMSASCSPNWGFNQTCWSRFPDVPPCQNSGCNVGVQGYENYPSPSMLYTPQNPVTYQGSQFISPAYGSPQRPISVLPNSSQGDVDGFSHGISTMPTEPAPHSAAPQYFGPSLPPAVPSMPADQMQPASPVPAAPMGLPPLPTPPVSTPGHSTWQPNSNFNPNQRPAVASNQALQSGSRYGISSRSPKFSPIARPASTSMTSGSLTSALVNNNVRTQPLTSNPVGSSGRYGSSNNTATSGSFARASVTPNHPLPNAANSSLPNGRYATTTGGPVTPKSQTPVSFASQSRVLSKSAGASTSYRSGRSMPPVANSPSVGFQSSQLPSLLDYPTMPVEPLRSTP